MLPRSGSPDWVIGIDDTDMPHEGGTGQLARRLADAIAGSGLGRSRGVSRHQLFEGAGVPKTSRNSAAALVCDEIAAPARLFDAVTDFVKEESVAGSDPGVAMAQLTPANALVEFARAAQVGLVTQPEAHRLAEDNGVRLVGLGGTKDGVIGALAALALRCEGNDGRFVGLGGIRDVGGVLTVAEILDRTGIIDVVDASSSRSLRAESTVDLGDWVRPRVTGGMPVLVARREGERWVNADARPN